MSDNVSSLPMNVDLDLDAAQRPEREVKPPFRFGLGGRTIEMQDPANLDWRDLALLENPVEFVRLSMSVEDRRFLHEQEIPGWKFNQLMDAYYAHFDLEDKVREAQRRARI